MRNFLISLNHYPYFRLPTQEEISSFSNETKKQYEYAESSGLLKDMLSTEIFFKMKELNRSIGTYSNFPIKGIPRILSDQDFNILTGTINYPPILLEVIYDKPRSIMNNKIKDFCNENDKTCTTYCKAQKAINTLIDLLQENYQKYDTENFSYTINFLHSLEYALRKNI